MSLCHSSPRGSGISLWPLGISQTVGFFFFVFLHRLVPVMSEDADLYIAEFHSGSMSMLENEDVCQARILSFPYTPRVSVFLVRYLKCFPSSGVMLIFTKREHRHLT